MVLDYIALGVLAVSVVAVLVIIGRKFPVLSTIDVHRLPKHRQERTKTALVEIRLYRKLVAMFGGIVKKAHPIRERVLQSLYKLWDRVKELERKYQIPENKLTSEEKIVREEKVMQLIKAGEQLAKDEQFGEAEKKFIEVISLDSTNVDAYKGLGEVYYQNKDYDHAKEVFQYALKLDQKDDAAHARLGQIAVQRGNFDEARKEYLQSVALNNHIADHHIDLGETYAALGDDAQAEQCFEEAVRIEPNNPRNLDTLIQHCIRVKKKARAQQLCDRLKEVNPENMKVAAYQEQIDNMPK